MIDDSRVQRLREGNPDRSARRYVLYWMQASQRVSFNHALEHAVALANELELPPLVCFGLMDDYPEANERHYAFMLEGLRDVELDLRKRGIAFVVKRGAPAKVALHFAKDAAIVVCDRGYTRHQKRWRDDVADGANCPVVQIESDVVCPVEAVSDHHEFAARTIRPKIHRLLDRFLVPVPPTKVRRPSLGMTDVKGDIEVSDPAAAMKALKVDRSVARSTYFTGGHRAARKLLDGFLDAKLNGYSEGRNEPAAGQSSTMSPYLHFGNISPIELALAVRDAAGSGARADRDSYLEELIVRRELAMNFVHFNPKYDSYEGLPDWARKTLAKHAKDKRPVVYTREQLESADTHDPCWNAAQLEMTKTGFMHNYMRMYWGKKILEWSGTPEAAYETTIELNNKYFLDGRDPNSWGNVGWIYGLHDRPWGPERPIFGLVRYMNEAGLRRKFDMDAYVERVGTL